MGPKNIAENQSQNPAGAVLTLHSSDIGYAVLEAFRQ